MSIYIYNSFTKRKEEFKPQNPKQVNIYSCGVTVYDVCHIGHARSLFIFDFIRRYLRYRGLNVRFVRNITDIDDKIINRARELRVSWGDLVTRHIDSYYEDLASLKIAKADYEPRATENIEGMIRHINGLIESGYAYVTKSGVYFNVRKFKDYGRLSGQSISQMLSGVRKEPDETKNDPLDFALWKSSKIDEPSWESPWGPGRPGWHIECSVMSAKYLEADTLDIHSGGQDLIFPHHENEIAQSEAFTGKPFAKYWIHHGLLTINGQKMAKSLGNFITIKDFINEYGDADYLKLFFLSALYRNPIDYTKEKIEEAKIRKWRIWRLLDDISRITPPSSSLNGKDSRLAIEKARKLTEDFRNKFESALDDDFNTPQALGVLSDMVRYFNSLLSKYRDGPLTQASLSALKVGADAICEFGQVLGVSFDKFSPDIREIEFKANGEKFIQEMIDRRNLLKKDKQYVEADKIRRELEGYGIVLEDTKEGTKWRRKI